jgi:ABC-type nitrate/sulfonate/bicarbonate transport system permease component
MAENKSISLMIQIGVVVILFALWDLSVRFDWVDSLFLTSPQETFAKIIPVAVGARADFLITAVSFFVAFVLGVSMALLVGFMLNRSLFAHATFMPLLVLGVTVPKVTLLPLFVLWFGVEKTTVVVYAALSAFFPMVVNVAAAGREVKPSQILFARASGFNELQIYRKVIFPAMLPVLISGLFYACNAAVTGVFIVELAQSRSGVGAVIHDLAVTFRTAELYAAVFLTATLTVTINIGLWQLARYFGRWRT